MLVWKLIWINSNASSQWYLWQWQAIERNPCFSLAEDPRRPRAAPEGFPLRPWPYWRWVFLLNYSINHYKALKSSMTNISHKKWYLYDGDRALYGGCDKSFVTVACHLWRWKVSGGRSKSLVAVMFWRCRDSIRFFTTFIR